MEDGLKEAITRCGMLQHAAEKAEQDLYKQKLNHKLEVTELQKHGSRQLLTHQPDVEVRYAAVCKSYSGDE